MSDLGALIVYDITDRDSYDKVRNWVKELRINLSSDTPILIAGKGMLEV
jgi:GTPase SAR1 family protein